MLLTQFNKCLFPATLKRIWHAHMHTRELTSAVSQWRQFLLIIRLPNVLLICQKHSSSLGLYDTLFFFFCSKPETSTVAGSKCEEKIPLVNVCELMLSMCVSVSVVSHRGDGLHMQSVFTGLKEIMTIAENPLAISLRSHFSFVCVFLCVHFVRGHGVCCLCKPVCVPCIFFVSTLACTVYYAYPSVTSNKNKNIPDFPLAC